MNKTLVSFAVLLSPDQALAWDPWEDVFGEPIHETFDSIGQDIENLPGSWTRCATNLDNCVEQQLGRVVYYAVWPLVERYKEHLFSQVGGNTSSIPNDLAALLQPYYPEIDVSSVGYSTNIDTIHGDHITWENHIFFVSDVNLQSDEGLLLLFHELEHVVQYKNKGGYKNMVSEYLLHAAGAVMESGTVNVHDMISVEEAANRKAIYVMQEFVGNNDLVNPTLAEQLLDGNPYVPGIQEPMPISSPRCSTAFGVCIIQYQYTDYVGSTCYCYPNSGGVDVGVIIP
jgi:hypothetical protein